LFEVWWNMNCLMFGISEIVIALCELRLNWKMNTWIMALIGIISLCLKTILKTRQYCHGGANLGHEIKWNISQRKPEYVLFSGVRLSLEKCERISAERQPNGAWLWKMREEWGWAPAKRCPNAGTPAGLEQNFNAEAERWNLKLSAGCQISSVCYFDVFHCINLSEMNYFDCLGMLWVRLGEYGPIICELWRNFMEKF